jgi:hypothetical protein
MRRRVGPALVGRAGEDGFCPGSPAGDVGGMVQADKSENLTKMRLPTLVTGSPAARIRASLLRLT